MTSVLPAAGVVALSLIAISRQRSATMPVALRVLPAALLFLTVPAASSGYWMIQEFQEIAVRGSGGQDAVMRLMNSVSGAMLWASVALVGTMVTVTMLRGTGAESSTATTLQIGDSADVIADPAPAVEGSRQGPGVPRFFALMTPVTIVPAVAVDMLTADIGSMLLQAATTLSGPNPSREIANMGLGQISQWISVRLIVIVGADAAGSIGLLLLALVNMLPMRQAAGRATVLYARIAAAVTALAAVWLAVRFGMLLAAP